MATDFTDRHADRFWAAGRACAGAETQPAVYALHRVDNQADLPAGRASGGPALPVAGDERDAVAKPRRRFMPDCESALV